MPKPKIGAIHYPPGEGRAIKGLDVYWSWNLKPLDLLDGLALKVVNNRPLRYEYKNVTILNMFWCDIKQV